MSRDKTLHTFTLVCVHVCVTDLQPPRWPSMELVEFQLHNQKQGHPPQSSLSNKFAMSTCHITCPLLFKLDLTVVFDRLLRFLAQKANVLCFGLCCTGRVLSLGYAHIPHQWFEIST